MVNIDVAVMSRNKAVSFCFKPHDFRFAVISITDPDKKFARFQKVSGNPVSEIHCSFWDEIEDKHGCITIAQAAQISSFIKKNVDKVDCFVVHCEAGICRSSGIAAAILKFYTGSDMKIFQDAQYTPNMTCYRRVLEAMYSE